jgi:CHAT domain-containing protein
MNRNRFAFVATGHLWRLVFVVLWLFVSQTICRSQARPADNAFDRYSTLGDSHFAARRFNEALLSYRLALKQPIASLKLDVSEGWEYYEVPNAWDGPLEVGRVLQRMAQSHLELMDTNVSSLERGIHLGSAYYAAQSSILVYEHARKNTPPTDMKQRLDIGELERPSTDVYVQTGYMFDKLSPANGGIRDEIYFASQRSRARVLLDMIGITRGFEGEAASSQAWANDAMLGLLEFGLQKESSRTHPEPGASAQLRESILSLKANAASLTIPAPPAWREGSAPWQSIQSHLQIGDFVLSYHITDQFLYIFVIPETGDLQLVEVPVRARDLERQIRENLYKIQTSSATWTIDSGGLFMSLIDPIKRFIRPCLRLSGPPTPIPSCHLIIVPDGAISLVPFAALMDPNTKRMLIEDLTISYMPMADFSIQSTFGRNLPESKRALLIGISKFDGLPDLRFTEAEVENLHQIIGNDAETYVQSRSLPSKSRILEDLPKYGLIHIATHGAFDTYNPLMSHLVLKDAHGRDTRLFAYELLLRPLAAELVVLSACETNESIETEMTGGGDMLGFPWTLLAAGADRVAVSLWQVQDDSTKFLMGSFYQRMLKSSVWPAEALRDAQLEQRDRTPHPRDWAAFSLIGEPR